ncbi:MAG: RsmB/NOP family class I SAM-dependent RNA methyltransferase [Phycisphaerales bacterium]|nr:RsmB/NOP family class I SAM-dependent RNA methyltransferase [Phycisphaerales bacterium]
MTDMAAEVPQLFSERLVDICGEEGAAAVLGSLSRPRPLSFRIIDPDSVPMVLGELEAVGIELSSVPWCPTAFYADGASRALLRTTQSWVDGKLFMQSISSMAAAVALQVEPGMHVLDLCAAPGGKTAMLGLQQQGRGVLLANDRSRSRLRSLRDVLGQHRICHAELSCKPGESFGGTHRDCFDRVLVDAPCSGEGMLHSGDHAGWGQWGLGRIRRLARQQERLLVAGLRCLRPGGVLVYATCTYAPEENESVLARVMGKMDVPVELEALPAGLPEGHPGLSSWDEQSFDPCIRLARRLLPDGCCTGFFMARFRRRHDGASA